MPCQPKVFILFPSNNLNDKCVFPLGKFGCFIPFLATYLRRVVPYQIHRYAAYNRGRRYIVGGSTRRPPGVFCFCDIISINSNHHPPSLYFLALYTKSKFWLL